METASIPAAQNLPPPPPEPQPQPPTAPSPQPPTAPSPQPPTVPAPQPPTAPPTAPQPPTAPAPASLPLRSITKRPIDRIYSFQNSPYYKMCATLKDLRPHILEVLRTPDFRNCKAAEEIREKMKILMDLYKELTEETMNVRKRQNSFPGEYQGQSNGRAFARYAENKPLFSGNISQNHKSEDSRPEGTYVVGGSAFGWNFVTFPGNKSIYYGRTKESFRSANPKSLKNEVPVSSPLPRT